MSKYIDADKLSAEIERRKKQDITFRERNILVDIEVYIAFLRDDMIITSLQQERSLVDIDAVREDFIAEVYRVLDADTTNDRANAIIDAFDSLPTVSQEQQELPGVEENRIPGKDYIPVEWVDACERYGKWKIVKQEQPPRGYDEAYLNECIAKASKTWEGVDADKYLDEVRGREQEQPEVDLEKEVDKFLNETGAPYFWCNDDEQKEWCNIIARHFFELGLNAGREKSNRVDGVVHHALKSHWIVTDKNKLSAILNGFPEGAEVELFVCAKKGEKWK